LGVKRGTSMTIGAMTLVDERPRLAALLGGISNAWALLEYEMASMLGVLISLPALTDTARALDPVSNELFDAFKLIDHRISLLRAAFIARVDDADLKAGLEAVFQRIKQASAKRGNLVHSAWGVSPTYPNKIIKTRPHRMSHEGDDPYGEKELLEAIQFIDLIHKEMAMFFVRVRTFLRTTRGAKI
jgi:hypothetical protein